MAKIEISLSFIVDVENPNNEEQCRQAAFEKMRSILNNGEDTKHITIDIYDVESDEEEEGD